MHTCSGGMQAWICSACTCKLTVLLDDIEQKTQDALAQSACVHQKIHQDWLFSAALAPEICSGGTTPYLACPPATQPYMQSLYTKSYPNGSPDGSGSEGLAQSPSGMSSVKSGRAFSGFLTCPFRHVGSYDFHRLRLMPGSLGRESPRVETSLESLCAVKKDGMYYLCTRSSFPD